ncbi:hypothetical protein HDU97_005969 [Phlyctochytrium planicorne]|nr:hypothetical protein HDU97_005969 [Phlyctochytrium planicorne]
MTVGDIKQVIFKSEPHGWVAASDMEVQSAPFDLNVELSDEDVLVKLLYISVDPYMRGRMRLGANSYTASFTLGEPMSGGCVAKVVRSKSEKFQEGTIVVGSLPWKEYHVVPKGTGLTPVTIPEGLKIPLSYFLGIAGMPGFTAYAGLLKIGKPKAGETLYVSAASGAVGLVVCQIGKALGLRVVGSAGSDDKVDYLLNDLKIDAAFNYKTVDNLSATLKKHCPDGIDIYFENVGGEMLDAVLPQMNVNGRIPVCGMISQYNATSDSVYGVKSLMNVIGKRLTFQGFIISDYYPTPVFGEFMKDIFTWIAQGKIVYRETVSEGIESVPEAFVGMLKGENFGKAVIKVADA